MSEKNEKELSIQKHKLIEATIKKKSTDKGVKKVKQVKGDQVKEKNDKELSKPKKKLIETTMKKNSGKF